MRRSFRSSSISILAMVLVPLVAGCKTRDWEDEGLLADAGNGVRVETVADEGNWQVSCVPSGDYESQLQYVFAVKGAVDERDETQPVLVSVTRKDGTDKVIADAIPGRGAISEKYGIFLGFHAGALTAETPAFEQDPPSYRGVLTLAEDERAAALDVTCVATKSS